MFHSSCFKHYWNAPRPTPTSLELLPLGVTVVLWTVNSTFQAKTQPPILFSVIFTSLYLRSHPRFWTLSSPLQSSPFTRLFLPLSFLADVVESSGTAGSCGAVYSSISPLSSLFFFLSMYLHWSSHRRPNSLQLPTWIGKKKYPAHPAANFTLLTIIASD